MSEQSQTSSGDQELQRHKDKSDFRIYTEFLDAVREGTKAEVVECLSQLLKSSTDTASGREGKKDEDDKSIQTGESTSYRQKLLNALAKKNVGAVWKLIAEGKEDDVKSLETLNRVCETVAKHERLKEANFFKWLWGKLWTQIRYGCCNKCCEEEQYQTDLQRDEEQQWIKILSDPLYISLEWLWRNNPKRETLTSSEKDETAGNVNKFEGVIEAALHDAHLLEKIALYEHYYSRDEYTKRAEEYEKFAADVVDGSNVDELHVIMDIEGTGCLLEKKPNDFNQSLSLLKIAADKERKMFVASPKCQRILDEIVYFEWPHWQDIGRVTKFAWSIFQLAFVVISWVVYIPVRLMRRSPCCDKDGRGLWAFREMYEHPYSKFINHTMWYLVFLILIMFTSSEDAFSTTVTGLVSIDYVVLCFVIGLFVQEFLEAQRQGCYVYLSKWWNVVDTVIILFFLVAYAVWLFSWVRFGKWKPEKPAFIVADVLYASATVMAYFHLTHIFQIDSVLGPLQLSLYKMLKDVRRFLFIFLVLYVSFATGVVKVYSYYVASHIELQKQNATIYTEHVPYANHVDALKSLFWLLLGVIEEEKIIAKDPLFYLTSFFGQLFFMVYVVCMVIVALNMLIAMMNSSYGLIMDNASVEWKFSRARMWLEWIDKGNTMPVPINLIYYLLYLVVRLFCICFRISKEKCQCCNEQGEEEQGTGESRDEKRERKERRMKTMKDLIVRYLKERYFGKNETEKDKEDSTDVAHGRGKAPKHIEDNINLLRRLADRQLKELAELNRKFESLVK